MAPRVAALFLLVVAVLGCGGRPSSRPPRPVTPSPVMRAHFIDVGQGDATFLELPCGTILIDAGGEQNGGFDAVPRLRDYLDGVFARRPDLQRTIDLLVVTHSHVDHTRGLKMVLETYKIRNVIDNGHVQSSGEADMALLHEHVKKNPDIGHRDVRVEDMAGAEGLSGDVVDPIRCPEIDPEIHALWGAVAVDPGWRPTQWGKPFDNENNHSVAVRVAFGNASFLFTGDLEEEALDSFVARYRGSATLDVDVYKVGHHGSRNGTTHALVSAMTPRMAIFSMGSPHRHWDWTAWQYGHPGYKVVQLLEEELLDRRPETSVLVGRRSTEFSPMRVQGASYGTGWEGTIVIEASARGRLKVETAGATPLSLAR